MCRAPVPVIFLVVAGCASTRTESASSVGGLAPMLSVERFLQAANTGDLEAMARMFGNADGAIAERAGGSFGCAFKRMGSWIGVGEPCLDWSEIELRMNAIAVVLQHDDYALRTESGVPGRQRPTTRVSVDIARGAEQFADVPFVVVQTTDGRWLVEEIGLEVLMAKAPSGLNELPEYASRASGVDERHEVPSRSGPRLLVDRLERDPVAIPT
jgi:hypothetical protein